jgi:hypothetical protein
VSVAARWLIAVLSSIAAFVAVAVPWATLSQGGSDRWEVIGPVASVVSAGVLAALGWWAARPDQAETRRVRQSARGGGNIRQTGGSQGATRRPGRAVHEDVRQKAHGMGTGDIDQIGGNRA